MIQFRKGIFETNSSTTHCLVVSRNRVTEDAIEKFKQEHGTHIVFGEMPYSKVEKILLKDPTIDENTSFQVKADFLYFSMYVWTENTDVLSFLFHRKQLTEKLNELGFTVEFREDSELLNEDRFYRTYDVSENMWEEMWSDINEVIDYLFTDHVLYYTWCDECCAECPKDIDEAITRYSKYENDGEQMSVHHYR